MLVRPARLRSLAVVASVAVAAAGALANARRPRAPPTDAIRHRAADAPHPAALTRLALAPGLSRSAAAAACGVSFRAAPPTPRLNGACAPKGSRSCTRRRGASRRARPRGGPCARCSARQPAPQPRRRRRPAAAAAAGSAGPGERGVPDYRRPGARSTTRRRPHSTAPTSATPTPRRGCHPSTGQNSAGTTIATLQLADFHGGDDATAADLTSYARRAQPARPGRQRPVPGGAGRRRPAGQGRPDRLRHRGRPGPGVDPVHRAGRGPARLLRAEHQRRLSPTCSPPSTTTSPATTTRPRPIRTSPRCPPPGGSANPAGARRRSITLEPIMESLVAAGVTVFASAGDDGIYDCARYRATTARPTSTTRRRRRRSSRWAAPDLSAAEQHPEHRHELDREVVGLHRPVSCQNTATGTGGTGGGASGSAADVVRPDFPGFPAPAYQQAGIDDAPFAGARTRLVPDIAADADPRERLPALHLRPRRRTARASRSRWADQPGRARLGRAVRPTRSPRAGARTGVGDIHNALYSAYRDHPLPRAERQRQGCPRRHRRAPTAPPPTRQRPVGRSRARLRHEHRRRRRAVAGARSVPHHHGARRGRRRSSPTPGCTAPRTPYRVDRALEARQGSDKSCSRAPRSTLTQAGGTRRCSPRTGCVRPKLFAARPGSDVPADGPDG